MKNKPITKNSGEQGELLVKAKLVQMMIRGEKLPGETAIEKVNAGNFKSTSGSFTYKPKSTDSLIDQVCESGASWSDSILKDKLSRYGIVKAGSRMKADVGINDFFYSLKSSASKPAIINHTFRNGFSVAAKYANVNLSFLDTEIMRYWENRVSENIGEDVSVNSRKKHNLFWSDDFKGKFRPIFNYFAFTGSGAGLSKKPADLVLEFANPLDPSSWKIMTPDTFYDTCWVDLIFSIRNKKDKIETVDSLSKENRIWARKIDGKIRGRLHVRAG
jgi:hypothetical protein